MNIQLKYFTIIKCQKNPNDKRHLYDNNKYAHFSKLNTSNYLFYPKYYLSHPKKYVLKKVKHYIYL